MPHPEIFLVRHGETVWNRSGHYQGQLDAPLTENGQKQARAIGRLARQIFNERGVMPFYCSPLGRCRQTAALICDSGKIDGTRIVSWRVRRELAEWRGDQQQAATRRSTGAACGTHTVSGRVHIADTGPLVARPCGRQCLRGSTGVVCSIVARRDGGPQARGCAAQAPAKPPPQALTVL